jgi:hypothetical protein
LRLQTDGEHAGEYSLMWRTDYVLPKCSLQREIECDAECTVGEREAIFTKRSATSSRNDGEWRHMGLTQEERPLALRRPTSMPHALLTLPRWRHTNLSREWLTGKRVTQEAQRDTMVVIRILLPMRRIHTKLVKTVEGNASHMIKPAEYIGMSQMDAEGNVVLELHAKHENGASGIARLVYPPTHPEYENILSHLGGLMPGEKKPVLPWS